MAEISSIDLRARQGLNPLQQAKDILLGWPLRLIGASVTALLLSQQPARALVYNLEGVDVTFPVPFFGTQSASITGWFDYSGGTSTGFYDFDSANITFNYASPLIADVTYQEGYVFNDGTNTYLVFNNFTTPQTGPNCAPATNPQDPCLRLNLEAALTGTPFEVIGIDEGSGAAGGSSTIPIITVRPLTATVSASVIAVPSPFSALLLAPLLPLLHYRRRIAEIGNNE